ncbi:MAG: MarR family transcriptional regulator [Jatrophihabitantaceae bacterium]
MATAPPNGPADVTVDVAADVTDPAADPGVVPAMLALRRLITSGEQFRHAVAAHFGMGLSETVAMSHLSIAGPMSPRELATRVGLTPSTVTSLLDRLEAAGLALRVPHPSDRRKSVVSLTDEGRDMLVSTQRWLRAALSVLSADRLPETAAVLEDLSAALDIQAVDIRSETARELGHG